MLIIVYFTFLLFRYRKQMEEMQRAFNKTIIKLQNTSRIAQEQVGPSEPWTGAVNQTRFAVNRE